MLFLTSRATQSSSLMALDECSQRKSELVKFLSRLGTSTRVRAVVFSRDHLLPEDNLQGAFHLPIDATHTEPDILKFIDSFIEETPELDNLRLEIRHAILQQCRGIFLWAWLMLEDLKDSRLVGEQKMKMANFPSDLPNTYTRLLQTNGSGLSVAEGRGPRPNIPHPTRRQKTNVRGRGLRLALA